MYVRRPKKKKETVFCQKKRERRYFQDRLILNRLSTLFVALITPPNSTTRVSSDHTSVLFLILFLAQTIEE